MQVNKVAGNFHFAAGHSYQQGSMHIHDMAPFTEKTLDFSHTIRSLSFGKPYPVGYGSPVAGYTRWPVCGIDCCYSRGLVPSQQRCGLLCMHTSRSMPFHAVCAMHSFGQRDSACLPEEEE
jgi:hypothetical protein